MVSHGEWTSGQFAPMSAGTVGLSLHSFNVKRLTQISKQISLPPAECNGMAELSAKTLGRRHPSTWHDIICTTSTNFS